MRSKNVVERRLKQTEKRIEDLEQIKRTQQYSPLMQMEIRNLEQQIILLNWVLGGKQLPNE